MGIEAILYKTLKNVETLNFVEGESASGKKFEDYVVIQLYQKLCETQGKYSLRVFPPRHTLREQTFSGVSHQFDIVLVDNGRTITVECKFRSGAHIDQLFATNGKIIDYVTRPIGIFLTTAKGVNNEIYHYGIAHHLLIITTKLPPVEYMLEQVKPETNLAKNLKLVKAHFNDRSNPNNLLIEWRNIYNRYQDEGYN